MFLNLLVNLFASWEEIFYLAGKTGEAGKQRNIHGKYNISATTFPSLFKARLMTTL